MMTTTVAAAGDVTTSDSGPLSRLTDTEERARRTIKQCLHGIFVMLHKTTCRSRSECYYVSKCVQSTEKIGQRSLALTQLVLLCKIETTDQSQPRSVPIIETRLWRYGLMMGRAATET